MKAVVDDVVTKEQILFNKVYTLPKHFQTTFLRPNGPPRLSI